MQKQNHSPIPLSKRAVSQKRLTIQDSQQLGAPLTSEGFPTTKWYQERKEAQVCDKGVKPRQGGQMRTDRARTEPEMSDSWQDRGRG